MSDLIDRQALMDVLEITMKCDDCQYKDTIRKGRCTMPSEFENACVAITDAPSAEPKRGKWEAMDVYEVVVACSECKQKFTYEHNYCPNCGAKMEVET